MDELTKIIEAMLFVSEKPLTRDQIRAVLPEMDAKDIKRSLEKLKEQYRERKGGFLLQEVAGGYQLRSNPELAPVLKRMVTQKPLKLGKATLETLSIIAYKQPVLKSEIEYIRGVDCGSSIKTLLEYGLVKILGRKQIAGKPLIYGTTPKFLEIFSLKSLNELPFPEEIEKPAHMATPNLSLEMLDNQPSLPLAVPENTDPDAAARPVDANIPDTDTSEPQPLAKNSPETT